MTKQIAIYATAAMTTLLALLILWQFRIVTIYVLISLTLAAAIRPLVQRLAGLDQITHVHPALHQLAADTKTQARLDPGPHLGGELMLQRGGAGLHGDRAHGAHRVGDRRPILAGEKQGDEEQGQQQVAHGWGSAAS